MTSTYFTQENDIVCCNDVASLLRQLGVQQYKPQDWCLFIDSSKRSLKCVLLYSGNSYGSVSLGHSTTLKEKYDEIKFFLEKISYKQLAPMDHVCRFENSWVCQRITKWLPKFSLLLVFVGQQSKNRALNKERLATGQ